MDSRAGTTQAPPRWKEMMKFAGGNYWSALGQWRKEKIKKREDRVKAHQQPPKALPPRSRKYAVSPRQRRAPVSHKSGGRACGGGYIVDTIESFRHDQLQRQRESTKRQARTVQLPPFPSPGTESWLPSRKNAYLVEAEDGVVAVGTPASLRRLVRILHPPPVPNVSTSVSLKVLPLKGLRQDK